MQLFGSLESWMALLVPSWPLLGPIRSQNGLQNGSKNAPKSLQKLVQKTTPKITKIMPFLGPKMDPKMAPKWTPKWPPTPPGHAFLVAGVVLWQHEAYFCWQAWYFVDMRKMRGQAGPKNAQDGPRGPGWSQDAPKKGQNAPRWRQDASKMSPRWQNMHLAAS